jgi:hypothetical protein
MGVLMGSLFLFFIAGLVIVLLCGILDWFDRRMGEYDKKRFSHPTYEQNRNLQLTSYKKIDRVPYVWKLPAPPIAPTEKPEVDERQIL